jgi:hypothetical protein
MNFDIVTAASLSTLYLEAVKYLTRRKFNQPEYDFPAWFYAFCLPVLNAVMPFPLFWLGMSTTNPFVAYGSGLGLVKYVIVTILGSLISMFVNNTVIKPYKNYREHLKYTVEVPES